jgi:23S rRNA (cytosine1962-C5)-methyltransferase
MQESGFNFLIETISPRFSAILPEPLRLFHGRGYLHDGLEHVNIEWYPPVLQLILYKPVSDELLDAMAVQITAADHLKQIRSIIVQQRFLQHSPSRCLYGTASDRLEVQEGPLKFEVQPGVHQNSGLFLDMASVRTWIRDNANSRSVLNLFAYTCSLSVAAIAGGATKVVNVDMSRASLDWGRRNHQLNNHDPRSVQYVPHNIFKSWTRLIKLGRYDLIIIDPPARQRGSFDSEKNYGTILKRIRKLAKPGAMVIASINSPWLDRDFLLSAMAKHSPCTRFLKYLPVSPGFEDKYPDRALKVYLFTHEPDSD